MNNTNDLTQSEIVAHKKYPTGDTALSRAITTGAPVATNDKQAAELTQSRPTPGGEWTTRGSTVYRDGASYAVCVNPRAATSIARRLNAADAMEKALKHVEDMLDPYREMRTAEIRDLQHYVQRTLAALRGGA